MLDIDPEIVASALERHGDYRVLRRHRPRKVFNAPGDAEIRRGLVIDLETTGLDPEYHEIIEVGMLPFKYDVDGRLIEAGSLLRPSLTGGTSLRVTWLVLMDETHAKRAAAVTVNPAIHGESLINQHRFAMFRAGTAASKSKSRV